MSTPSNPNNAKPGTSIGKYILLSVFVIGPTVVFTLLVTRWLSLEMRAPVEVEKVVAADPAGDRPPLAKPELHPSVDALGSLSLPDLPDNEPRISPALASDTLDHVPGTATPSPDEQDLAMDRNARELALRIRTARPDEQATLRRDLERLTVRHFLHRQQRRQQQIDELSQGIEKLRGTQQQRQANQNEIVQRRVRELLDPKSDPPWDESGTAVPVPANASAADLGTDATIADSNMPAVKDTEAARRDSRGQVVAALQALRDMKAAETVSGDGDPAIPVTADPSLEKTYDGVPYSQWLKMLETERKPAKLSMAVEACSRLANEADEHRIARGIFHAAALFEQSRDEDERNPVWGACMMALSRLSTDVIAEEVLAALRDQKSYKSGRRFQGALLVMGASIEVGTPLEPISEALKTNARETIVELVKLASPKGKDSGWLLAAACSVCQLSGQTPNDFEGLQPLLVRMIDDGFKHDQTVWNYSIPEEWKVVAEVLIAKTPDMPDLALKLMMHWTKSSHVLDLVGQMGRHAEPVVPIIVDLFVGEWKQHEVRIPADRVPLLSKLIQTLGEIGIGTKGGVLLRELQLIAPSLDSQQLQGAVELAISKFAKLPTSDSTPMLLSDFSMIGGEWQLKSVMPPPPRVAGRVEEYQVLIRRPAFELIKTDESRSVHRQAVEEIGTHKIGDRFEISPTAMPKQITLKSIVKSLDSPGYLREGLYELTETTLRIQLAAVGQPRPASLVKGNAPVPQGHVLLEFRRGLGPAQPATTAAPAGRAEELPPPVQPIPQVEKTYDGVTYSQWLTMLETEQKPEKLSTAINACSRLAIKGDEHRIARGIFLAAGLLETAEFPDQNHVWVQAWMALKRLPEEAVIDELLVALRDRDSYKNGREFQGRFVAERYSETLVKSARIRDVIGELVNPSNRDDKGSGWLVAGACRVWQNADLPIDAIDGFQARVFQMIDEGLTVWRGGQSEQACFEWCMVVEAVVTRIPETPGLALRLAKLAKESPEVVRFIGRLGRRAEPVVPALVDQFLAEWKLYEEELRENETGANQNRAIDIDSASRALKRRCQLIETLGDIGAGQLGAELVRELKLIAPPGPNLFAAAAPSSAAPYSISFVDTFFKSVHEAFPKLAQIPLDEATPILLSDFSMINGEWRRKSPAGAVPETRRLVIQGSLLRCFGEAPAGPAELGRQPDFEFGLAYFEKGIGRQLRIDPTTAPRKITLFDFRNNRDVPGTRREGLYELTRTTLRIQLAPPGQPIPTEMAKDKAGLPEGHLLLELVRKTPEAVNVEEVLK